MMQKKQKFTVVLQQRESRYVVNVNTYPARLMDDIADIMVTWDAKIYAIFKGWIKPEGPGWFVGKERPGFKLWATGAPEQLTWYHGG